MTKYILIDKITSPLGVIIGYFSIKLFFKEEWTYVLFESLMIFVFSCLISFLRKENYILEIKLDENDTDIVYQKNLDKKNRFNFSLTSKSIKSMNFSSKSIFNPSHTITIKYIDENELHNRIKFKTNSDDTFINLIYKMNEEKLSTTTHNSQPG